MPDRQITIKVSLDGLTDASAQAKDFTGSVQGIGDAAATATSAAAPLGAVVDTTAASLKVASGVAGELTGALKTQLGPAAEQAYAAFEKLASAQGPRGLSISIAQATVATEAFKKAVQDAEAAGTKMPPAIGNALKTMQGDIAAATQKLGDFRKTQADVGASAALAGSQLDALRGRAGSLSMMFDSMERTGTGAAKSIGALGVGIGIGVVAFEAAVAAGEKLGKAMVAVVDAFSKADLAAHAMEDRLNLEKNALDAVAAGHISFGRSMLETIANYKIWQAEQTKSTGILKDLETALKELTPATNMQEAIANEVKFGEALSVAFNKGKIEASLFLESHKQMVAEYIATQQHMGEIVPKEWEDITKAIKQAEGAQKLLSEEGAKAAVLSISQIIQARKNADDEAARSAVAAQGHFEAEMKRLNQEVIGNEEYSAKKKRLYEEMANAEQIAADKQKVADAEAELAQAKLQASMNLSDDVMRQAVTAAADYAKGIEAGVRPSTVLKEAVALLEVAVHDTGKALPDLDASLKKIAAQGFKEAGDQADAAKKQLQEYRLEVEKTNIANSDLMKTVEALNTIWKGSGDMFKPMIRAFQDLRTAAQLLDGDLGGNVSVPG